VPGEKVNPNSANLGGGPPEEGGRAKSLKEKGEILTGNILPFGGGDPIRSGTRRGEKEESRVGTLLLERKTSANEKRNGGKKRRKYYIPHQTQGNKGKKRKIPLGNPLRRGGGERKRMSIWKGQGVRETNRERGGSGMGERI